MSKRLLCLALGLPIIGLASEGVTFAGVISAAWQSQSLSSSSPGESTSRGGYTFQPEISYPVGEQGLLGAKFGFSVANGLNGLENGFALAPWAADLEDDVRNINGRNRDYLLTGWYRHSLTFGNDLGLVIDAGVIDSTDYIDLNAYANDEFLQFLNGVFVNTPLGALPSYDLGANLALGQKQWLLQALVMDVGDRNTDPETTDYQFYALELTISPQLATGEGNYRVLLSSTSDSFPNISGNDKKRIDMVSLSLDQALGNHWGLFGRFSWQNRDAKSDHTGVYSGGLSISGGLWNRDADRLALGVAYLNEGSSDIRESTVGEIFYRLNPTAALSFTFDVQYQDNENKSARPNGNEGVVYGIRGTVEF